MSNRIFALEEAYVTIYEEYSPIFNAPVMPRSRTIGSNGWQLTYDLQLFHTSNPATNLAIWDRPDSAPRTVYARWLDIYMTDLHFERRSKSQIQDATGLPGSQPSILGPEGSLSFSAAHLGRDLEDMQGYNRFWRIFLDKKKNRRAPIEDSWMLMGCWVDNDSFGGEPFSVNNSFNVKEFYRPSALWTANTQYRFLTAAYKDLSTTAEQVTAEILTLERSKRAALIGGTYNLMATTGTNSTTPIPTVKFTYNGVVKDNVRWINGAYVYIDGLAAGVLTMRLMSDLPPASGSNDTIIVAP